MNVNQAIAHLEAQDAEVIRLTDARAITAGKVEEASEYLVRTRKDVRRRKRCRRLTARSQGLNESASGRKRGPGRFVRAGRAVTRKWTSCANGSWRALLTMPILVWTLCDPVLITRFTTQIALYKHLVGIRSIKSVSATQLQIEYDIPATVPAADLSSSRRGRPSGGVVLAMEFVKGSKRLLGAGVSGPVQTPDVIADRQLIGSDLDIEEAVGIAAGSGDIAGLVADVLVRLRPVA